MADSSRHRAARPPGLLLAGALLLLWSACGPSTAPLNLGSTTSTYDSGLLDALVPAFQADHPEYTVRVIAVGTGEALELGERGDVDVLLVHAPAAELEFVAAGHGRDRRPVMYNDFVIVGPAADPAGIRTAGSAEEALGRIAAAEVPFFSRGDDSGTHKRELAIWAEAGITPTGDWYREAGEGQAALLLVADQLGGYTLSDRGTYISLSERLAIEPLFENDPLLLNIYSVIDVTRGRHPDGARAFGDWMESERARVLIADFGRERYGRPLFTPITPNDPPPALRRRLYDLGIGVDRVDERGSS